MDAAKPNFNSKHIKMISARFITYTLIIFAISASLPIAIEIGDVTVFSEDGPIEWLQISILLVSAAILFLNARSKECDYKQMFCVLAQFLLIAAIREMDLIFDRLIPIAGWKLPVIFCLLAAIIIYWNHKELLVSQVSGFVRTRAFALLWCGFIVAIPYAQLVGNGKFLQLLMGDDYVRDYKRVIEELGELLGYLLLMIGSIEAVFHQIEE